MKQYITTQLVEADERDDGNFTVVFKSLGFGAFILAEQFKAECHPIDRLEVGFGLAMEGMKHGLWFYRLGLIDNLEPPWPVGLVDGKLVYRLRNGSHTPVSGIPAVDLVAEDWVVAP